MKKSVGSRKIEVRGVVYRWRAMGSDYGADLTVWPVNGVGASIHSKLGYHEFEKEQSRPWATGGGQAVITNRVVRQVIVHAIEKHGYDPDANRDKLMLGNAETFLK